MLRVGLDCSGLVMLATEKGIMLRPTFMKCSSDPWVADLSFFALNDVFRRPYMCAISLIPYL